MMFVYTIVFRYIFGSQVPGVIYASDTLDITRIFISDFNSKNPAAAASTAKP